ncbi:universal stress protein [Desulfococcaceae bacterium HSG7]|nr:universal stress protein [Desulfococcaceae bacterium HSG7]
MKYQNVLVLTDFSKDSDEAVKAAVDFAKKYNSRLTVLNVVRDTYNLTYVLSDSEYHGLERKLRRHAEELFDKMETEIPELAEIGYERKIRTGTPYISCLYEIEKGNYDLVFAGSHGRTDLKKVVMGSTAEKVLRRSPISVFVTRR